MDSENWFALQACIVPRDGRPGLVVMFEFARRRFETRAWLDEPATSEAFDAPLVTVIGQIEKLGLAYSHLDLKPRQATLSLPSTPPRFHAAECDDRGYVWSGRAPAPPEVSGGDRSDAPGCRVNRWRHPRRLPCDRGSRTPRWRARSFRACIMTEAIPSARVRSWQRGTDRGGPQRP